MLDDSKRKVVLALEEELIARIKRGEPIHLIRKWLLTELGKHELMFEELTPFGQAFVNQIAFAYQAWQREEEDRARERKLN